ncbi:MAG: hypothetical protein ABI162_00600 [Luteolibacter sp.]
MRLLNLKEAITSPFLKMKIDGVVELLGPVAKRVNPGPDELRAEIEREQSHQRQAKSLIDSSISMLTEEIIGLLKKQS